MFNRPNRALVYPLVEEVPEERGGMLAIGFLVGEQVPQGGIIRERGDQRADDTSTVCPAGDGDFPGCHGLRGYRGR